MNDPLRVRAPFGRHQLLGDGVIARVALPGALIFGSCSPLEPSALARDAPLTDGSQLEGGQGLRSSGSEPPAVLRFAFRPPRGRADEYEMSATLDRDRLVLMHGVVRGGRYPVLIALHGQPKRGEAPQHYAFPATVIEVVRAAVDRGEVAPLVLALPVFRFFGENWPAFDLVAFTEKVRELLASEEIEAGPFYAIGHSGASGCGGDGMNRAHRIHPAAVGFFDTCLGEGWQKEILALRFGKVPTLIVHSVETAGFARRQAQEYLPTFDFGQAYHPLGLAPAPCPDPLPDAPLRPQPFRCASDPERTTRALVLDTGEGETAHEAVLPIALRYFLREYVRATM